MHSHIASNNYYNDTYAHFIVKYIMSYIDLWTDLIHEFEIKEFDQKLS